MQFRFSDSAGTARTVNVDPLPAAASDAASVTDSVVMSAHLDHARDGVVISASIANHGAESIRLGEVIYEVATGFPSSSSARFFKHGYQSWSGSAAVDVGLPKPYPCDAASFIARLNHQSEVRRPAEFPESQTSELFTIVESSQHRERVMAGFVGAASALTTVTVPSPDRIVARVILDEVELARGAQRELEPLLLIASDQTAARLAARWAEEIGHRMTARVSAPYQRGWCSWYHYFHTVTEDALRENIRSLAAMRKEFPIEVIQLDDGFQSALGDWDLTNEKFPSGLRRIAEEIRGEGFQAGIWTAPFLASRDSRLMRDHPKWFITRPETGEPLRAGRNPNWTASQDPYAYALDASNSSFRAHLEHLFSKLTREFGFSYLKLDFLYAGAAEGIRHDPGLTRGESLRKGLEAIRAGAG
ncbi:MAG: alpha-galactosidase, partial [Candidatus Binatus sp.]|nr:alpha-galactosidase [Candidatus Binatus sp.]